MQSTVFARRTATTYSWLFLLELLYLDRWLEVLLVVPGRSHPTGILPENNPVKCPHIWK
jgi:hypothetical protein